MLDVILAIAGITIVGGLVLVPAMIFLMRRGNSEILVWEMYPNGWRRVKKRGVLKHDPKKGQTLVIYEKGLSSTTLEEFPISISSDGIIDLFYANGKYLPADMRVDVDRVKASQLLNRAVEISIKNRIEKNAARTINKNNSLLSHPAVSLMVVGFILIASLLVVTGPLNESVKALNQNTLQLSTAISQLAPPTNTTATSTNTGARSPFVNKRPAG